MFTVKAVIDNRSVSNGPDTFQIFECASVRVEPSKINGQNGPGQPAFVPPDWDVLMYDKDRNYIDSFHVGSQLDHYNSAYVMNEQGRTVQQVHPIDRSIPTATR